MIHSSVRAELWARDTLDEFDVGAVVVVEEEDASLRLEGLVDEVPGKLKPVFGDA